MKRYLSDAVIILAVVGAVVFWQLYQQHQRNVETGNQMIKTAEQWERASQDR